MAKATPRPVEEEAEAPKYRLDKLRENAVTIFGVSRSTFDGATYQLKDGDYSIPEIKDIISEWERKEAK